MTTGTAQYEDFVLLYIDEFITGMTAKEFEMKARQFIADHRLTYNDGKKDVPLTFTRFRDTFQAKIIKSHFASTEEQKQLGCGRVWIYKFTEKETFKYINQAIGNDKKNEELTSEEIDNLTIANHDTINDLQHQIETLQKRNEELSQLRKE